MIQQNHHIIAATMAVIAVVMGLYAMLWNSFSWAGPGAGVYAIVVGYGLFAGVMIDLVAGVVLLIKYRLLVYMLPIGAAVFAVTRLVALVGR